MLQAAEPELRHLISLQNIEHLQNRHSLGVWRNFPNIIPSIVHRDRIDPDRGMVCKIVRAQKTAEALYMFTNCMCNLTLVKRVPSARSDLFIGIGEIFIFEKFSFLREAAPLSVQAAEIIPLLPGKVIRKSIPIRSEEHTSELQSRGHLVCRLL